jgi:hypothetical protein
MMLPCLPAVKSGTATSVVIATALAPVSAHTESEKVAFSIRYSRARLKTVWLKPVQSMPAMLTSTSTTGVRVGAGVGSGVGDGLDRAGVGSGVGCNVGAGDGFVV